MPVFLVYNPVPTPVFFLNFLIRWICVNSYLIFVFKSIPVFCLLLGICWFWLKPVCSYLVEHVSWDFYVYDWPKLVFILAETFLLVAKGIKIITRI